MKRHQIVAALGVAILVIGMLVLMIPVMAQDETVGASVPPAPEVLSSYYEAWVNSPHADVTAEAFNHWNEEDPQEVSTSCARCHSTPGYVDYLGGDGSEAGVVDVAPAIGTTITCDACHNEAAVSLASVTFPSGVELANVGDATRCMVCHQGRASGLSVDAALADAGALEDMNAVNEGLRFINIHYYAAAASLYGSEVHGGYEFEGNTYQSRSDHVEDYNTCVDCHNPHTLELNVDECATCHEDVEDVNDIRDIRMNGSLMDYDGDGDTSEGISEEISTLQEITLSAIQAYAEQVIGTPIVYNSASYPYWFNEAGEGYSSWTGHLVQATYNYQMSVKDPGGYAHNPKYHIELLFDTITMLNEQVAEPVDVAGLVRNDAGHFDSTGEPFRHWDEEGEVSATCTKCHTAEGLPFFLENGVLINQEPSNSLACTTCHNDLGEFTLYPVTDVTFPSGAVVSFGEDEPANMCINCHQGRESTVSVSAAIAGTGAADDEVSDRLRFRNPHYFAAGATMFGGLTEGGYQYDGQEYSGQFPHTRRLSTCVDCHDVHTLELQVDRCVDCHEELEDSNDVSLIRYDDDYDPIDYNGNGDVTEPILQEINSFRDALYTAMQDYAVNTAGSTLVFNPDSYPYWFNDAGEGYAAWTPRLLRAAYNYTYSVKDPGSYAHNADYILQILFDSLSDLGADVSTFTRPPVRYNDGE